MTTPATDPLPTCGQCGDSFETSIAVFVLDALAPSLVKTPLADAEHFAPFLSDTATRACAGLIQGPGVELLAAGVYCVAAAHLANYVPEPPDAGPAATPLPPGCRRPRPAVLRSLGDLIVTGPERGLALLRGAADDFYDR